MKLKGSKLLYVKARMKEAEENGRGEMPIRVHLTLSSRTDFNYVKSDLGNYQANVVKSSVGEKLDLKSTGETLTMVEVPAKNLRKVLEQRYVRSYEWPGVVELLAATPKGPIIGAGVFGQRAPDDIEVLDENPPKPSEIRNLTNK